MVRTLRVPVVRSTHDLRECAALCQIEGASFYFSPQKQKWRLKGTRAWQKSESVEDFIVEAKEYLQAKQEAEANKSQESATKQKQTSSKRNSRKTKKQKKNTKAKNSDQNRWDKKPTEDVVRPEFLELFDDRFRLGAERGYKPAWIWHSLLTTYFLTPSEICWLCTVFDYNPGWAYHQVRYKYGSIGYRDILATIACNRSDWLNYFNQRWNFASYNQSKQRYQQQWQNDWNRQKHHSSTQTNYEANRYQNYLDLLQIKFPFSRQELKSAYRKQALKAHPDTGGTPESFRKVHNAFEVLSNLAS